MKKTLFLIFFLLFFTGQSFAQVDYGAEQKKLENQKAKLLKEIQSVQSLLNANKKKERDVLAELTAQNKKIKIQQGIISNSKKQIRNLANDIYVNKLKRNKLQRELKVLKKDYEKTIRQSYKIRSDQSKFMYILSAENLLQAYKRIQYIKQYAKHRQQQGEELQSKTEELTAIMEKLEVQIAKQEKIAKEQEKEQQALEEARKIQAALVAEIKKDSKLYASQIKTKQLETKKIDQQIRQLIQKSIEEANRRAREKAEREAKARGEKVKTPTTTASSTRLEMTPEDKVLASNFKANKGRLPWPVTKGYISLGYGDQPHPMVPNTTIHNSGVEITTEPGAPVRAVFDGEVMNIQIIGNTRAVSIRHGEYITVYQNLNTVSVQPGQKVSTKQSIGTVGRNFERKYVLKFVLSRNTSIENPQSWLSRK